MYTKIKGTNDFLPEKAKQLTTVEHYLRDVVNLYGYEEIRTPIIESTDLIHRSTGSDSDIVKKETYDFIDRGNRPITLRPEGTAPTIRAVIENKLYVRPLPLKLFYCEDNFRYERPQKGRYREFRQFGVEVVGSSSPYMDGEVISLAYVIFSTLGIKDIVVKINTIGDDYSKNAYTNAIKDYLKDKIDGLCEDCKKRYETNPLRILDCKVDKENRIFKNVPKISDYLSEESKAKFDVVKGYLNILQIPFEIDENLVRGLDYYTETVFEIETKNSVLGQAKTVCGGGRYDKLVKELGGPDMKCIGFSFGMERLLEIIEDDFDYSKKMMIQIIPLGIDAKAHSIRLIQDLRITGLTAEIDYEAKNLKAHFKAAENNNARFIVIIGDEELEKGTVKIKDKQKNTEEEISESNLKEYIINSLRSHHCSCGDECCDCEDDECDCDDENCSCHKKDDDNKWEAIIMVK